MEPRCNNFRLKLQYVNETWKTRNESPYSSNTEKEKVQTYLSQNCIYNVRLINYLITIIIIIIIFIITIIIIFIIIIIVINVTMVIIIIIVTIMILLLILLLLLIITIID